MITIIEGTDGVGKTSYAKRLAEQTSADYLHASEPKTLNWANEYVFSLNPAKNYVLDRWHVGEMIWPKYFDRDSLFPNIYTFNACNTFLSALNTHIIIIKRDEKEIIKTLTERGETQQQIETSILAQRDFLDLAPKINTINVAIIDSNVLYEKEN